MLFRVSLTAGTSPFSAWEEAASVVTARLDTSTKVEHRLMGAARPALIALLNMTFVNAWDEKGSWKGRERKKGRWKSGQVMIHELAPMRIICYVLHISEE